MNSSMNNYEKRKSGSKMDRRRFYFVSTLSIVTSLLLMVSSPTNNVSAQTEIKTTKPLRIGIIGAGWLGGTVGRLLVQAGHEVMFSSRHPENHLSMVRELGARAFAGNPRQAAEFGTVLVFAVPYDALPELGKALKDVLYGKIVLDACNPSGGNENALTREANTKGVAQTSVKYLAGTRLVRAFSAVDATAIEASSKRQTAKLGIPLAGNDTEAVRIAAQLVRDVGSEPVVVGNLESATSFQRGGPGFRANTTAPELRRLLGLSDGK